MWALVWDRGPGQRPLYWSVWIGWTEHRHSALLLTSEQQDRSAQDWRDELPTTGNGVWEPVYRRFLLYVEPVTSTQELDDDW